MIIHVPITVTSEWSAWIWQVATVKRRPSRSAAPCFTWGPGTQVRGQNYPSNTSWHEVAKVPLKLQETKTQKNVTQLPEIAKVAPSRLTFFWGGFGWTFKVSEILTEVTEEESNRNGHSENSQVHKFIGRHCCTTTEKKKDLRLDYSDTQNKLKLLKLLLTWPTFKKFKVNP